MWQTCSFQQVFLWKGIKMHYHTSPWKLCHNVNWGGWGHFFVSAEYLMNQRVYFNDNVKVIISDKHQQMTNVWSEFSSRRTRQLNNFNLSTHKQLKLSQIFKYWANICCGCRLASFPSHILSIKKLCKIFL